jgi:hypothetical protein
MNALIQFGCPFVVACLAAGMATSTISSGRLLIDIVLLYFNLLVTLDTWRRK